MEKEMTERITQVIDERIIRLRREIADLLGRARGGPFADGGCNFDKGCCNDKGCCGDKGCCKKADPADWQELVDISDRLGISLSQLIDRILKLDSKLLAGR